VAKGKGGRPTKYKPEMCDVVIELGKQGAGRLETCLELDIVPDTFLRWEEEHPEFSEATTRARQFSQAWWESQGRKGIWSREFNASAYSLQMRNRFPSDWRDKHDLEHSGQGGGPIPIVIERDG
jgi:hypothetical protein